MSIIKSCSELSKIIRDSSYRVIGIDGKDGAGKSPIAKQIAQELDFNHINLDDFLLDEFIEKNRGGFVPNIKYDQLQSVAITSTKPIIIEGVCLLVVLQKLDLKPDLLIYVKRMVEVDHGIWIWKDNDKCDITENIEDFITKEKKHLQSFVEVEALLEGKQLDTEDVEYQATEEEIIRYHYNDQPHKRADIIYENTFIEE